MDLGFGEFLSDCLVYIPVLSCLESTSDKHQQDAFHLTSQEACKLGRDGSGCCRKRSWHVAANPELAGTRPGKESPVVNQVRKTADVPDIARQLGGRFRQPVHSARTHSKFQFRALVSPSIPVVHDARESEICSA